MPTGGPSSRTNGIKGLLPDDFVQATGWSYTCLKLTESALLDIDRFCHELEELTGDSGRDLIVARLREAFSAADLHPARIAQGVLAIRDQLFDDLVNARAVIRAVRRKHLRRRYMRALSLVAVLVVVGYFALLTTGAAGATWGPSSMSNGLAQLWSYLPDLDDVILAAGAVAHGVIDGMEWLGTQRREIQILAYLGLGYGFLRTFKFVFERLT